MHKKIPENAKCVFKGIIYDVYQWEQEMFDGSFETFERLYRRPSVIVLPMDIEGNVYYSKQEQPAHKKRLDLFGGRTDEGEDPLEAAKRELIEESGLEAERWIKLDEIFDMEMKIDYEVFFFLALNCKKVAEPNLDCGEKVEVFKMPLDQFINDFIQQKDFYAPYLKKVISDYSDDKKKEFKDKILSLAEDK